MYKNLGCDFVVLGSYLDISDAGRNIRFDLRVQDAALGETVAVLAESGSETALPDLIARAGNDLRQRLGFTGISASESASVQASLPSNPDAMRLYASGLERLRDFDALGARDFLQKAIEADPNYAMAYLAVADAWETLGYSRKAVEAAKQAFDHSQVHAREDTLLHPTAGDDAGHAAGASSETRAAPQELCPTPAAQHPRWRNASVKIECC